MQARKDVSMSNKLLQIMYLIIGPVICTGLLLFYVFIVANIGDNDTKEKIYYFLLITWALFAAMLFKVGRSDASLTHKSHGTLLKLRGPVVVVFCLVLLGSFKFVPTSSEEFDVTVRVSS